MKVELKQFVRIVLCCIFGCSPSALIGEEFTTARVTILPVDIYGAEVPYYVFDFTHTKTGENAAAKFNKLDAKGIAPGRYRYELRRRDIRKPMLTNLVGEVDIAAADNWVTVLAHGFNGASPDGQEVTLDVDSLPLKRNAIKVMGYKPSDRTWLQARRVFTGETQNARVRSDGTAIVTTELGGEYVIILFEGVRPISSAVISLSIKPTSEIRFSVQR